MRDPPENPKKSIPKTKIIFVSDRFASVRPVEPLLTCITAKLLYIKSYGGFDTHKFENQNKGSVFTRKDIILLLILKKDPE